MGGKGGIKSAVMVREFDPIADCLEVEEVERKCEVGPSGELSLFTDLLGDPLCRVRHSPSYLMLVLILNLPPSVLLPFTEFTQYWGSHYLGNFRWRRLWKARGSRSWG